MEPILATSLLSLGTKVLDRILPEQGTISQTTAKPFADLLKSDKVAQGSELSNFLKANGVRSMQDVETQTFHLSNQLLSHPQLARELSGLRPDEPLNLTLEDGSLWRITDNEGKTKAVFSADSEVGQLANRLHQLKSIQVNSAQMPGASLSELVASIESQENLTAFWTLR